VRVVGRLKQGGKAVSGAVEILAGSKVIVKTTTKAGGLYAAQLQTSARTLRARATVPDRPLAGGCLHALFPNCVSATIGGFTVTSEPATVKR
jgi:hypothetical protein